MVQARVPRFGLGAALAALAAACLCTAQAAPTISAGTGHALAARADGAVLAWGADVQGELGQGALVQASTPRALAGLADIAMVAAGDGFALALRRDGRVYSWGRNVYGQLGDGTRETRPDPRLIPGLGDVVAIGASGDVGLALKSDGTVWSWGLSVSQTFGRESLFSNSTVPGPIPGLSQVRRLSVNRYTALAVVADGSVWAWGWNAGDGTTETRYEPVRVPGITTAVEAAAGAGNHMLVLLADGTVRAWGENDSGQLGDGTSIDRRSPVAVTGLANVRSLAATFSASAAVLNDGTVMAWGSNAFSMLGMGPTIPYVSQRELPGPVPGLSGIAEISAGVFNFLARRQSGEAFGWGDNEQGQLGDGTTLRQESPVPVAGLGQATSVVAGEEVSFATFADGSVRGWGSNRNGMLAVPRTERYSTPQVVRGIDGVTAVAAGYQYSLALRADGTVWAWGRNDASQLGDGSTTPRSAPVQAIGLSGMVGICAGLNLSAALRGDGTVWIWGYVRQGIDTSYGSPEGRRAIPIPGLSDVAAIACGSGHLLALRRDGSLWALGYNGSGQLGRGATSSFERDPAPVNGLAGIASIAGSYDRSFAVGSDGALWAWGSGRGLFLDVPMLGDGSTATRATAFRVPGVNDAVAVASARHDNHTLLIRRDGSVWAWGNNFYGELGDGTTAPRGTPGRVAKVTGVVEVEAGGGFGGFSFARYPEGGVIAWGDNYDGELADGTFSRRATAVASTGVGGAGVLDTTPATPSGVPPDFLPAFFVLTTAAGAVEVPSINTLLNFRPSDVGSSGNVYVFALAPASSVRPALKGDVFTHGTVRRRDGEKETIACVLAQLNAQGQLVAVSAAGLQAYVSGVLSAQGQLVTILNNVPTTQVGGSTFYVGYGSSGPAMLNGGTNRSVVTLPGGPGECKPQAPQTGWWYNAAEGGRGFSIEARGTRLFFGAFHYDTAGRAVWNYAGGPTSLDGSLFTSDFVATAGGQTLDGPYRPPSFASAGNVTLAFSESTQGTIAWPGGTTAIERLPFVPNGLTAPPQPGVPEAGWWWNPSESGRGFFIEWQNGWFHIAGYMYDEEGRPRWYLSAYPSPDPMRITGNWWLFGNGQAPGQPYRPATRVSENEGALDVQFTNATTGTLTLPGGRRIPLVRMEF